MFEHLIKALKELDGTSVSVPFSEVDADGYSDHQCPATECEFLFKVHSDDWRNIVKDEAVWCPFCGHQASSDKWWTHEQIEKAKEFAFAEVKNKIKSAMREDAERFNRRQPRNSFISISMKVDNHPKEIVLPLAASNPMRLKITCAKCTCRYAVIGSAYFCPACGHNAADLVFGQSLGTIRATLDNLDAIAANLPDRDAAENTVRLLKEHSLQQMVTAFQRYAEALYSNKPELPTPRRNVFQNLDEGSKLWEAAFGKGYNSHLDAAQLSVLNRYFQQRHLLTHREGLVDADYIARTNDRSYRERQRLVIGEGSLRECLILIEKLAAGLASDVS
jgi:hypothetical protein